MKKKRIIISMLTLLCSCTGVWAQSASDVLSGVFTINANGVKVQFSKGNLQKIGSNYQFAEHQYDYIGNNQSDNNKDLFAFNGYSTPDASWFNMSHAQWKYLLATRSVTNSLYAGARYTMATLDGTYKGLIIFPDNYTHPDGTGFVAGTYNDCSNFTANVSLAGWALMEAAGCVFLPAAGYYSSPRKVFDEFGKAVEINTTTSYNSDNYYTPTFKKAQADCDATSNKNSWMSVRLVQLKTGLQQDADGYYLIGTVQDWKDFAALVEIMPKANAKMTADIDLGTDQTMIGTDASKYKGTFDGQNHTLTIHYVTTESYTAPFRYIEEATINYLHVAGTINTSRDCAGGIVAYAASDGYINYCSSSIALTSSFSGRGYYGGIVGDNSYGINIKYSYFDGSFNAPNATWCGGILGDTGNGTYSVVKIDNCLFRPQSFVVSADVTYYYSGTFTPWDGFTEQVTPTNCYFTFRVNTSQQGRRVYTSENVPEGAPTTEVTAADGNKYYVITRITGLTDDMDFEYGQAGYYFVNLLKTGTKTLTLTAGDVQELEKASTSTIKIYDDQGKNANSMCGNSTLVLNAPEGYQLQLTGYVKTYSSYNDDNFKVYDGNSTSATLLYEKGSGSQKVNIGPFTSTGQSLTINFSGLGEGLNLTATLVPPLVELADNSDDLSALSAYAGKTCKVTYSRSFTNGKTSTVCLPFAYTKKAGDGSFYEFTDIEKKGGEYVATMTEPGESTLTANTPYLYKPNADGSVDFSGTYEIPDELVAGSTVSNGWTFKGTYTTIEWTTAPATPTYGFSASSANDGITQGQFVKVGSYVRIKPMRCYLEKVSSTGARGMSRAADEELPETIKVRLIGADGEVTAIGSLQTKTGEVTFDEDAWYSLDGRRIEGKPTVKGIYVNNGKKIVVK